MDGSAPALSGILEAAVYVDDLDRAEEFYGTLLGLERIARAEGRHAFFRCGGTILLTFIARATETPPAPGALAVPVHGAHGPGHVCFAADGLSIDRWRARLEAASKAIEADFLWPNGARSIYFRDPAGNSVELPEPRLWDRNA